MNLKVCRLLGIFLLLLCPMAAFTQGGVVEGSVRGEEGTPVSGATIQLPGQNIQQVTDTAGSFRLRVPAGDSLLLLVSHIGYRPHRERVFVAEGEEKQLLITLQTDTRYLREVSVQDSRQEPLREQSSLSRIAPKEIEHLPSPFGDISGALATLPGVSQNNELSSSYAVRGGNFDENLVYVNEIPVYRPFLLRAGQQEGLSFVNPALVSSLTFSSGGWQAKWGDKLSSVLNIRYKQPDSLAASVTAGLLGGGAQIEGVGLGKRLTYVAGVRHKSAQYLLNTLDTQGEYLPRFTDLQAFLTYQLSSRTDINLLLSYARNRYLVEPESRQTNFGTLQTSFQLNVGFEGQELLQYSMWQNALKLTTRWNNRFKTSWIASYLHTTEKEYTEVEGGYFLCSVDKNPESATYNECLQVLGIGTDYQHIRNRLQAGIYQVQSRNEWRFARGQLLEFGLQLGLEQISDRLREWAFADSADFVQFTPGKKITNDISLLNYRLEGYVQNTSSLGEGRHSLHYGLRYHYFSQNGEWLWSPRLQYAYRPDWLTDVVFTASTGLYQQPPLYREFRTFSGQIQPGVLAQKSLHAITGADLNFLMWGRTFNFVSEAYYKRLWDVNAYDIDNVRIRYFANNDTRAYAAGADFRLSGEFIPGAESWFSLGVLKTAEDVPEDERGYIRRPSDQRLNIGIFFQDHIPNDPSLRVYLKLLYGSGLPFGPPQTVAYRNVFRGRAYRRVDIGFSKDIRVQRLGMESLWLGLEVMNLLGNNNVISYNWISDFNNMQYAVPNTLSSRFFNLKAVAHW